MSLRSGRLPRDLSPNRLTSVVARRRASGAPILDLTESNPTRVGLTYPSDLLAPLGSSSGLQYAPEPFGTRAAREAVSADFARRGVSVPPARIALTASTSEAYALLFKLLCDPGDRVLVPRPSYPLFEHLTALESVEAVPYALDEHAGWRLDVDAVAAAIEARTKAVLVVSPNNPTGSTLHRRELDRPGRARPVTRSGAHRRRGVRRLSPRRRRHSRVGSCSSRERWRSDWAVSRSRSGCRS